jgi:hypothetical protein
MAMKVGAQSLTLPFVERGRASRPMLHQCRAQDDGASFGGEVTHGSEVAAGASTHSVDSEHSFRMRRLSLRYPRCSHDRR